MKAQCERCKEIVELSFAPRDGGIEVSCSACKASYFVASAEAPAAPAAAAKVDAEPEATPEGFACPKCGRAQAKGDACRFCGLVFARWSGKPAGEDVPPEQVEALAEAKRLWSEVEQAWGESERHDRFLTHCQKCELYAFAAARYRAARGERGGAAEPTAGEQLEKIRRSAEAALFVGSGRVRAEAGKEPYRGSMVLLAALLALLALGLVWAVFRQQGQIKKPQGEGNTVPVPKLQQRDAGR